MRAVEAAVLFHTFRLGLKVVPFQTFRSLVDRDSRDDAAAPIAEDAPLPPEAQKVRRAMTRVAAPHDDTCLSRALAARVMLRRRGIGSTLHFGTAREEDGLHFHAWLRHGPHVVTGGGRLGRYTEIAAFPDGVAE